MLQKGITYHFGNHETRRWSFLSDYRLLVDQCRCRGHRFILLFLLRHRYNWILLHRVSSACGFRDNVWRGYICIGLRSIQAFPPPRMSNCRQKDLSHMYVSIVLCKYLPTSRHEILAIQSVRFNPCDSIRAIQSVDWVCSHKLTWTSYTMDPLPWNGGMWPMRGISVPGQHDCLIGRGGKCRRWCSCLLRGLCLARLMHLA